jgi:hypothetical protein
MEAKLGYAFTNMAIQVDNATITALNGVPTDPGGYLSLTKGGLYSGVREKRYISSC